MLVSLILIIYVTPLFLTLVENLAKLMIYKSNKLQIDIIESILFIVCSFIPFINIIILFFNGYTHNVLFYNKIQNETYRCYSCGIVSRAIQYDKVIIKKGYFDNLDAEIESNCLHCGCTIVKDEFYYNKNIPFAKK